MFRKSGSNGPSQTRCKNLAFCYGGNSLFRLILFHFGFCYVCMGNVCDIIVQEAMLYFRLRRFSCSQRCEQRPNDKLPKRLNICCDFRKQICKYRIKRYLCRPESDPSPDGGIGRRAGLKHQWSDPCRFDPGSGYQQNRLIC